MIIDDANQAVAEADHTEADVHTAVETAEDAAESSLTAGQVAICTEAVAAIGTVAGILSAWLAFKQHNTQLPPELKVPDVGRQLPPELMRPPPDRRVSTAFRQSVIAHVPAGDRNRER